MGDKITNDLSQNLDKYQELIGKHAELEERVRKAEEQKGSVREEIFQRVYKEYQQQIEELSGEIKPLASDLESLRQDVSKQLAEAEAKTKEIQDTIEELTFRHRVGEFGESEFAKLEGPPKKQVKEFSEKGEKLRSTLDQIEAILAKTGEAGKSAADDKPRKGKTKSGRESAKAPKKAADEEAPPASGDDVKSTMPEFETAAMATAAGSSATPPTASGGDPGSDAAKGARDDSQDMVDTSKWTEEFAQDNKNEARRVTDVPKTASVSVKNDDSDPLSKLADPSLESDDGARPAAPTPSDVGVSTVSKPTGFPVMIITKGPGAGKKLPLVPMSMTMGREHDNNIELKDEEVARYHARISFQRGKYILEDLDSSSGTWVNDEKITEATLKHGDKIKVGTTELMVDFE